MSQFEKAVKLSDEQFLRAVGVDKTGFNLILERVATHLENVREERPMKKRGKKSEVALPDRLLLTFTYLRHYPTFARLGLEFGISESYANKIYHQILDVLVKVLSMKNRKHLLESNLQTIIIDVTEQPIERPTKGQRAYYSGKKTAHHKSSIDCVFGDVRNIIGYLPQRECSRLQNSEGKPSGGFPRN